MIRKCSCCKEDKDIKLFNFRNVKKGIRLSYCAECGKEKTKKHYLENKDYYKNKARISNEKYLKVTMGKIFEYFKEHPCIDCSESDPIVLEFDHVKGVKVAEISKLTKNGGSWEKIEAEIGKCEVRCANCHRRRTAKQQGWYSYLKD